MQEKNERRNLIESLMTFIRGSKSLNKIYYGSIKYFIEILAENRFLPKSILRNRSTSRARVLRSFVHPDGIGAEIGVQKGFFTHVILHHTQPRRLHLIDPWYLLGEKWAWATTNQSTIKALSNIIYWFQQELVSGKVVLHINFDEQVLLDFPDAYFDWVYLDTSHSYDHTKRELALLDIKIKPSGIILGDDWFPDPDHKFFGQYRAINEFVSEKGYRILYADDTDNQWVIKKQEL